MSIDGKKVVFKLFDDMYHCKRLLQYIQSPDDIDISQMKKKTQGRQGRPKMNYFSIIKQTNM